MGPLFFQQLRPPDDPGAQKQTERAAPRAQLVPHPILPADTGQEPKQECVQGDLISSVSGNLLLHHALRAEP